MKRGLSGIVVAINCVELDYPLAECIRSLLPVCDEVCVSDGGSRDGTLELLQEWEMWEPKLRVLQHMESLWPNSDQVGNNWVNAVRKEANYDSIIWLDADEILDPAGFDEICRAVAANETRIFNYVNFWQDSWHTTPWGDGMKQHLKPSNQWMPVHGKNPDGYVDERHTAQTHPSLITYHYSALRRREAFFAKQKRIGWRHAFGYADQPLIQAEKTGESFFPLYRDRMERMEPFTGQHPEVIKPWLKERGWATEPPVTLPAEIEAAIEKRAERLDVDGAENPEEIVVPLKRFRGDFMDARGKLLPL